MEITAAEMNEKLNNYLLEGEKSICPVFGSVKRKSKKLYGPVSDYAYMTVTTADRLLLYRFDMYSSYVEYYTFDTLMMGDVSSTGSGQYIAELSFLTEKGTKDLCLIFSSTVKGGGFPKQPMNADFMCRLLNSKIG